MRNIKKIVVSGTINGKSFLLKGKANIDKGIILANYRRSISGLELHSLSLLTLTGCPSVAKTEVEEKNPWVRSNGIYTGERSVEIDGKKIISSVLTSEKGWVSNEIHMNLDVKYDKAYFKKNSFEILPTWFQEEMTPFGKFKIQGLFSPLAKVNGELKRIHAYTTYVLPKGVGQLEKSFRDIFIGIDIDNFKQTEKIIMYS